MVNQKLKKVATRIVGNLQEKQRISVKSPSMYQEVLSKAVQYLKLKF